MDEDVRLSIEQAHQKWIGRMLLLGVLSFFGFFAFWIHECNSPALQGPCADVILDPRYAQQGVLACPDKRQSLSFPTGWTWGKCSCQDHQREEGQDHQRKEELDHQPKEKP
jgi:hypothetical protein